MQFHLVYSGPLRANGSSAHKHEIRRALHPQLKELWHHKPLVGSQEWVTPDSPGKTLLRSVDAFEFAPLICDELAIVAELDVVLLRPTDPGAVISQGGDMDNQLKTLFDALRYPDAAQEIPSGTRPSADEHPFFCLLDDDDKIATLSVAVDRYLAAPDPSHVHVSMFVKTRQLWGTIDNLSLA